MSRDEQQVFDELSQLCAAPGYIHAIAQLSLRDNVISYSGRLTVDDTRYQFSPQRLLRTEFCILIGLTAKTPVDTTCPLPDVLHEYIQRSDTLLAELHHAISK